MSGDLRSMLKAAEAAGCTVTQTRGGHWRIVPPAGEIIIAAATPSDHRSLKNLRAMLRRAGVAA